MEKIYQDLAAHVAAIMSHAYAPYSHYHVGACVLTRSGEYIDGVNVENASYGLSNCAERSALFAAYSKGYRKQDILALAIRSDGDQMVTPCGACRQVMVELLAIDTPILLCDGKQIEICYIQDLLPRAFTSKDVK